MSSKLIEILKTSSLRSMLSDSEIDEVYQELNADFEDFLETETERITDEVKGTSEIEDLKDDIKDLNKEIAALKKNGFPSELLNDTMTINWLKDNWEGVVKLYHLNKSPKEIINIYQYGETLLEMGRDAAPEISKAIDKEIIAKCLSMKSGFDSVTIYKEPQPGMEEMMSMPIHPEVQKETDMIAEMHDKQMYQNKTRIILVGRAASGKDHMRKQLESRGYKYAVSFTTRPPRTGEVDGKDYFFLTNEQFEKMIANNEFYEHVSFNGWHYGTSNDQFYNDDIFIMTPHGLSCVKEEDRKKSFVMFFDMKEGVRRRRLMERSDADSVDRRLAADNLDFADFKNFDIKLTNHDF